MLAQLLYLGQRQHLVGQLCCTVHRIADFMQGLLGRHVAAQRRLHLSFEHRQRCAQLVRCVAHKPFLVAQQMAQPLHHLVGRSNQRLQFARGGGGSDGAQVALATGLQLQAQVSHGACGALHYPQHGEGNHCDQQGLAHQGLPQNLQCQGFTHLQRLCHLDHGHAAAFGTGHRLQ